MAGGNNRRSSWFNRHDKLVTTAMILILAAMLITPLMYNVCRDNQIGVVEVIVKTPQKVKEVSKELENEFRKKIPKNPVQNIGWSQ